MERWIKSLLFSSLLLITIVVFLKFSFVYLTPFIIAVLFASLINPAVNKVQKITGIERSLATFLILSFFISIFFICLFIGVSQIYLELNKLLHNLPDYNSLGKQFNWFLQQNNKIEEMINSWKLSATTRNMLNDNLQLLYNTLKSALVYLANYSVNLLAKLPLILSIGLISCIATYFISRDLDKINDFIMSLFPLELRAKIHKIEKEIISSALGFLRAELILILITGFITFLGLVFLTNDYALILALAAAILDLIPIIGPGLIFLPWIIFNIITGNLILALKLLIIFTFTAAIRQAIEGKVIGSKLGLHPLVTMMAFYIGYRLLGAIGFIIGPAALVFGKAIYNSGILNNLISFRE